MTDPIIIEPMIMKNVGDCGIACLSMYLGIPYARVIEATIRRKRPEWNGLSRREMIYLAKRLGVTLIGRELTKDDLDDDDVGILDLDHSIPGEDGHYVIYGCGTIYNPAQGDWWMDLDSYLARTGYIVCGLITRKP